MYRTQSRILYALPGTHDSTNQIEFCDRSINVDIGMVRIGGLFGGGEGGEVPVLEGALLLLHF